MTKQGRQSHRMGGNLGKGNLKRELLSYNKNESQYLGVVSRMFQKATTNATTKVFPKDQTDSSESHPAVIYHLCCRRRRRRLCGHSRERAVRAAHVPQQRAARRLRHLATAATSPRGTAPSATAPPSFATGQNRELCWSLLQGIQPVLCEEIAILGPQSSS